MRRRGALAWLSAVPVSFACALARVSNEKTACKCTGALGFLTKALFEQRAVDQDASRTKMGYKAQ